ncbi:endonuclease/exonuclease/phosphatase family protein [Actinomycetospora sp. NBRC 106375]|uniref:endonuclease/exonuclease/phosphatase family protein n=1 Tax=Actinomycetospora sp. NBRC 106375 TaxID=3032207 RepID=UPI002553BA83|nr:endonuclease/exonuclease/phosphatase family protein [Actinomycetospora sp. NBRC 106375]
MRRPRVRPGRRVRRGLGVVALLAMAACSTPAPAPPPDPAALRVMTWNVETHAHDPSDWAEVIAVQHPDVLALQEICAGEADELAAILQRDHGMAYRSVPGPIRPPTPDEARAPVNEALGPACGTGPDDVAFGLAVLSRLPVSDPRITAYPPDHRDEQRGFMSLRVTTGVGPTVAVYNTHLGLNGVGLDQVRRLADAATARPAVVLGDLNIGPTDPELAPLRAGFTEVDPGAEHPTTAEGKIDYVFLRGLTTVDPPDTPDTTASDHRPLVADLRPSG